MKLYELSKAVSKSKKRLGRGIGSGRGKTAGRGTKGQKARGSTPPGFVGGALPIYKKLPYKRGYRRAGHHDSARTGNKRIPIKVGKLEVFKAGATVDLQSLIEQKVVGENAAKKYGVKIVGTGEIDKGLTVKLPISKAAAGKIEKAGGKIVNV